MAIVLAGGEGRGGGDGRVVAENAVPGVEQHALAIAAGAVKEEQRVVADRSSEAITEKALAKVDEILVAVKNSLEEGEPARAVAVGAYRRHLRHQIRAAVGMHYACAQINC